MGGTFDPIHHGHLVAASEVQALFDLDEVVFVPTGQPWQKAGREVAPAEHRYLMTVVATASNPRFTVSRVDIERDGPFSAFPGVDRTLVLIEGNGMRLASGSDSLDVRAAYEPVRFPGESAPDCALVDGPTRDFNLMVRRGTVRGDVVVVREAACDVEPARTRICYAAAGACACRVAAHAPIAVPSGHALLVTAPPGAAAPALSVTPVGDGAVALVAVVHDGGGAP